MAHGYMLTYRRQQDSTHPAVPVDDLGDFIGAFLPSITRYWIRILETTTTC